MHKKLFYILSVISIFLPAHAMQLGQETQYEDIWQAVKNGSLEIIQNCSHLPEWQDSLLIEAARFNQVPIATFLIGNGANLKAKTVKDKWTALHMAAIHNSLETAQVLITAGADLYAHDNEKRIPLEVHSYFHGWYPHLLELGRRGIHMLLEKAGRESAAEYVRKRDLRELLYSHMSRFDRGLY